MKYNLKHLPFWLMINTYLVISFIAMIFFNQYWNFYSLSIFLIYVNSIVLILVIPDKIRNAIPKKTRTVPSSISKLIDYILIITFAWAGWYITAVVVFVGMIGEAKYFEEFDNSRNNKNKEVAE